MALFNAGQLADWLQYEVDAASAAMAEMVVAGWLANATRLAVWPDPLPAPLFAWALELGGIAFENPTSQSDDQARDVRTTWSDRRRQILQEARDWAYDQYGDTNRPGPLPAGAFPAAVPLPDPAFPWRRR